MVRTQRKQLGFALVLACSATWIAVPADQAHATNWYQPYIESSHPDVFYNFYIPGAGGAPTAMYPSPRPTPPLVGHTYYTYQPLMPHEHMYKHRASYHQYYNSGLGLNRTKVRWLPSFKSLIRTAHKQIDFAR